MSDTGNTKNCLECGQQIAVRADGKFVMHALPGFPIECQGSREAAYHADTHGDLDAILDSPDALLGAPAQATGRQILVLMPEGSPGEPDWGMNGTPLGPLPEGTHTLDIQAYWHITDADGKFQGGATGMKIDLGES